MKRGARRTLFAAVGVVVIAAVCVGAGCRSYAWNCFKWNCLSRTPYMKPAVRPEPGVWDSHRVTVCWIGQATVLANVRGMTFLTDPVLTKRIAPVYVGGHVNLGIRRITALPIEFRNLPPIDVVLLSHAHYDHWDVASLKYFGTNTTVLIPPGTRDLLPGGVFGTVVEAAWGSTVHLGRVSIEAFPVEHWGGRTFDDKVNRGYNGYVISDGTSRMVFIGDSAFGDRESPWRQGPVDWKGRAGQRPVDLAILPIGVYAYPYNHMCPEDAWGLAKEIGAAWIMPIHWRTFIQSPPKMEPIMEPMRRLQKVAGAETNRIVCREPGETFVLP